MMIYAAIALSVMTFSAVSAMNDQETKGRKHVALFVACVLAPPAIWLWVQVFI